MGKDASLAVKCEEFTSIYEQLQTCAKYAASTTRSGEMAELNYKEHLQRERATHTQAAALAQRRHEELEARILDLAASHAEAVQRAETVESERDYLEKKNNDLEENCQLMAEQLERAISQGARLGVEPIYAGTWYGN